MLVYYSASYDIAIPVHSSYCNVLVCPMDKLVLLTCSLVTVPLYVIAHDRRLALLCSSLHEIASHRKMNVCVVHNRLQFLRV